MALLFHKQVAPNGAANGSHLVFTYPKANKKEQLLCLNLKKQMRC